MSFASRPSTSKKRSNAPIWRAVAAFIIVAVAFYVAATSTPKLGLDLSGGTQLTLETQSTERVEADAEATDRTLEVLRGRVDQLGVAEPTLARSGDNRIIVELPGEEDPERAEEVIGTTAQLTFHPVTGTATPQELKQYERTGEAPPPGEEQQQQGGNQNPQQQQGGDQNQQNQQQPQNGQQQGDQGQGSGSSSTASQSAATDPVSDNGNENDDSKSGGQNDNSGSQGDDSSGDSENGQGSQEGDEDGPAIEQINPTKPVIMRDEQGQILRLGKAAMDGNEVKDASATMPEQGVSAWQVNISFTGQGGDTWANLTSKAACARDQGRQPQDRVAIVLDDRIISSPGQEPTVQCGAGITGGESSIVGDFSQSEADELATLIKGGALPVPVEVIENRTVGPTLGDEAIDASYKAAIIGIILTGLFIWLVYRLVGLMATIALACYAAISFAMLTFLGATLTLPGLAGFVLSIGMAIDANVLIFERAREEYEKRRGEGLGPALDTGYRKAWSAIIDSNVTTLLSGALLFFLATGPVKGFGVTLSFGVIASMISALLITRVLTDWLVRRAWARRKPELTGITGGGKIRHWLENSGVRLMKRATTWIVLSATIVILALAGFAIRGMNLGVEFTGGRVLEYSSTQEVNINEARQAVADAGFPQAVVQESGDESRDIPFVSVRTDEIPTSETDKIEQAVASVGENVKQQSDTRIGPTLGEELRDKALIAFGIAVAAQMLYLAIRFRWTWAAAAVLAMLHDVLFVVGLFTWWGKPIDGVFLAAILSIIGLSVNDTIVVFDRIRERRKLEPDRTLSDITSDALLQTLPRTINTGLGAMFILGALAFLGGESLTDFSLALLFGLTIGIFSSIFTASPIAITLERIWPAHKAEEKKKKRQDDPYANVAAAGREPTET